MTGRAPSGGERNAFGIPVTTGAAPDAPQRNRPRFDDLPVPDDTANLREGPDLHPDCTGLLPLIGVWRGSGALADPALDRPRTFGQQIVFAHDGRPFLSYESRAWLLDDDGGVAGPADRETGFWRPHPDGALEVLIVDSGGLVLPFHGRARNLTSWEMQTGPILGTRSARSVERATRLYGIVPGTGDLGFVDEREFAGGPFAPYMSVQLSRVAG